MGNAVSIECRWWSKTLSINEDARSFAYEEDGKVVISSHNRSVAMSKEALMEVFRLVFPDSVSPAVEPKVVGTPPDVKAEIVKVTKVRKAKKGWHFDHSVPRSLKVWTRKEDQTLIDNANAMGADLSSASGKKVVYELTAKQLGRSIPAVMARFGLLIRDGRIVMPK